MKKSVALRLAAIPAFVAATTGSAMAALPTEVSTAITGAQTDLLSLLSMLTTAGIAIWAGTVLYNRFKVR